MSTDEILIENPELQEDVLIDEPENLSDVSDLQLGEIGNDGMRKPFDYLNMSKAQQKMWDNQNKPNIDKIYYSILFENGRRDFGTSIAKDNFNFEDFRIEKFNSFKRKRNPPLEVTIYDTIDQFQNDRLRVTKGK